MMKFGRLTIETVNIVVQVMKARNMTLVSTELGISQPAVSFHVKKFEDIFGRKIITRVGNNLVVSSEGDEVIKLCNIILNCSDNLQSLSDRKGSKRKYLGISPASFFAIASQFDVLRDIVERYQVVVDGARALDRRYNAGELHAVFRLTGPSEPPPELSIDRAFRWVGSSRMRHSGDEALPILLEERGSVYAALAQNALDTLGTPYRVIAEINDFQALKMLVEVGAGYALLPNFLIGLLDADAATDGTALSGVVTGIYGLFYHKRDVSFTEASSLFGQIDVKLR